MRADVHHVCALMHVFHIMMVHAGTCSAKDSLVGKGKEVAGGLMGKPGMKEEEGGACARPAGSAAVAARSPTGVLAGRKAGTSQAAPQPWHRQVLQVSAGQTVRALA